MASNSMCQPCSRTCVFSIATNFCLECEEPICCSCVQAHKSNKTSRKHQVTNIEAASSATFDTKTELKECSKHRPSSIELFCKTHEVLCCIRCMTQDHRSCDDVVPLEDVCHNVKQSSLLYDTRNDLQYLLTVFKQTIEDRKQNKENIKSQTQKVKNDIKEFSQSMTTKLPEMEKSVLKELDNIVLSAVEGIENDEHKAENGARLIETYLQKTEFLTTNGSNHILFTLLNYLQPKIKSEYSTLEDIIGTAFCYNITFKQNENILSDINEIGSIETKKTRCEINIIRPKDAAAQDVVLIQHKPIKSLTHDFDFDGTLGFVTGLDVDRDNNVFFANTSCIRMYNQKGNFVKRWLLKGTSYDLACHKTSGRIAVSLRHDGIQLIDSLKLQPIIPVASLIDCLGITFITDNIAVGGEGKISLLDYNGEHIRTITTETSRYIAYLHNHQSKLYFTDFTDKLYCIKEDGTKLLTMTLSEIRAAQSVNTDQRGVLYVAGYSSDNVVRLSQDGKNCDVVLKAEDDIKSPFALCFSRDYKKMFVSSRRGKVVKAFTCEY